MSSQKVLVISGSPRVGGNSDKLCDNFVKGAAEAGHEVEKISLADKNINFCTACYACENGDCIYQDDAPAIVSKMLEASVIVLATPVYFYSMCAQLKALIDRSVMKYPDIVGKKFYFIMTMADTLEENFTGTIEALRGFVDCCEHSRVCDMLCVTGVYQSGEIDGNPALEKAYLLGKSC